MPDGAGGFAIGFMPDTNFGPYARPEPDAATVNA